MNWKTRFHIKEERLQRFMEKQAAISAQGLKSKIGSRKVVLADSVEGDQVIARTSSDAPEIDGVVHIPLDDYELEAG